MTEEQADLLRRIEKQRERDARMGIVKENEE